MAHYVVLGSLTEQGIKDVQGLPQRVQAARQRAQALGGTFEFFLTMGQYDYVVVAEATSDDVMTAFLLDLGSRGNSRTLTLKAFTEDEAAKIVARLPLGAAPARGGGRRRV